MRGMKKQGLSASDTPPPVASPTGGDFGFGSESEEKESLGTPSRVLSTKFRISACFARRPVVCEQSRSQHIQQEFTMTKMTKAQLVDENIALLEQQPSASPSPGPGMR